MSHNRARKSRGGQQRVHAGQMVPVKRYTINHEAMQRVSALGTINPDDGTRSQWQPHLATERLAELTARDAFDQETYCDRCDEYDGELAIRPDDLELPPMRHEQARQLKKAGYVGAAWRSWKPESDVHVTPRMKSRPGGAVELNRCHMCLIGYLDEVPPQPTTSEQRATLQATAWEAREAVFRLRRAAANEGNSPTLASLITRLQASARTRLQRAVGACYDAGFRPWRPAVRRIGDEAPSEVVATTLEIPGEAAECE